MKPRFTARQEQALALLAEGYSNQRIAEEMGIKKRVVENYVAIIYHELGCNGTDGSARVLAARWWWFK
jgi:DNA-binding CsgD family transcriptional regulator